MLDKGYVVRIYAVILFLLMAGMFSCKPGKSLASKKIDKNLNASTVFDRLAEKNKMHEWFGMKANANIYFDRNNMGGKVDVRIQKDKAIWMSVRKFGFEISRILITPDSVFVVNRFYKEYYVEPLDKIRKKYKIPFDFEEMQEFLVTGMITKDQMPASVVPAADHYLLKTRGKHLDVTYKIDSDFNIVYAKISSGEDNMEAYFDNFKDLQKEEMPFVRKFFYPDQDTPRYFLKLKIKKIVVDKPQNLKFKIPESYERI